jgi:hypothetical protein
MFITIVRNAMFCEMFSIKTYSQNFHFHEHTPHKSIFAKQLSQFPNIRFREII